MALSYTKKSWVDSEIVKAVDANKWENGINDAFSIAECGAGKIVSGFIEDGGQHNVGDIWLSRNNKGTFKCTVANTDNFIDVAKWLQIDDLSNATKLENLELRTGSSVVVNNITFTFTKIGKVVIVGIVGYVSNVANGNFSGIIPDGFIPTIHAKVVVVVASGDKRCEVQITAGAQSLQLLVVGTSGSYLYGELIYFT